MNTGYIIIIWNHCFANMFWTCKKWMINIICKLRIVIWHILNPILQMTKKHILQTNLQWCTVPNKLVQAMSTKENKTLKKAQGKSYLSLAANRRCPLEIIIWSDGHWPFQAVLSHWTNTHYSFPATFIWKEKTRNNNKRII